MSQIKRPPPGSGDPAAMFSASYDRRRRILLTRFAGCVGPEAVEEFDRILAVVREAEGPASVIVDLTRIDAFAMPASFVASCSKRPPVAPDCKRIFVVQHALVARLVQRYIDAHAIAGFHGMLIASSVDAAVASLDVGSASFRPFDLEWLRKELREEADFRADVMRRH